MKSNNFNTKEELEEFFRKIDNPAPPKYRPGDVLSTVNFIDDEISVIKIIGSYYHGTIQGKITAEDVSGSIPTFYKFEWLNPKGAHRVTGMNIYGIDTDWYPLDKETIDKGHELWDLLFKD